jgi:hypothetical protein
METLMTDLDRLKLLERKVWAMSMLLACTLIAFLTVTLKAQPGAPDELRIKKLTIVDDRGTERVILAAPLPDPIVNGERVRRSGAVSGITISDAKGNERGGFAIGDGSGEAFIGLDSETTQEVLLLANPKGGSHLSIFDGNRNLARIGVLGGEPTLVVRQRGTVVFEQPTSPAGPATK